MGVRRERERERERERVRESDLKKTLRKEGRSRENKSGIFIQRRRSHSPLNTAIDIDSANIRAEDRKRRYEKPDSLSSVRLNCPEQFSLSLPLRWSSVDGRGFSFSR